MKHLAAMNIVGEAPGSTDGYTATPLSNSLTEQKYRDGIIYTYVFQKKLFPNSGFHGVLFRIDMRMQRIH